MVIVALKKRERGFRKERKKKSKRIKTPEKLLQSPFPWPCDCNPNVRHSNWPIRRWQLNVWVLKDTLCTVRMIVVFFRQEKSYIMCVPCIHRNS